MLTSRIITLGVVSAFLPLFQLTLAVSHPPVTILGASYPRLEGGWLVYSLDESDLSADLNGDGDRLDQVVHARRLATGGTKNFQLAGYPDSTFGDWVVIQVFEGAQGSPDGDCGDCDCDEFGTDLNCDGDREDQVVHVARLSTGQTLNLGLSGQSIRFVGNWLVMSIAEYTQGDLNGDGDTDDLVPHVHHLPTGQTVNLKLAASYPTVVFADAWLALGVDEVAQGADLNGDGDRDDFVLHIHDLFTGETTNLMLSIGNWELHWPRFTGSYLAFSVSEAHQGADFNDDDDMQDDVVHIRHFSTSVITNLRLTGIVGIDHYGDWLMLRVSELQKGADLNGDGDKEDYVIHVYQFSTGAITNLGLVGDPGPPELDWYVFEVEEAWQGEDLNADGDRDDRVVHAHRVSTGETTNLRLAGFVRSRISGEDVLLSVDERQQGADVNGDGDSNDQVLHIIHLLTGRITNLMYAGSDGQFSGDWLLLWVNERQEAADLNGDGDSIDWVHHVRNRSTGETTNLGLAVAHGMIIHGDWAYMRINEADQGADLNGDGDTADAVVHVYRFSTNQVTNLRVAGSDPVSMSGDWLVFQVSEEQQGADLNADGDTEDSGVYMVHLDDMASALPFHRGDPNSSGTTDISDGIAIFGFLFLGDATLSCNESADADNDGTIDISDGVYLLNWLFVGGPEPVAPGPTGMPCGFDPDPVGSPGDLGCEAYEQCS